MPKTVVAAQTSLEEALPEGVVREVPAEPSEPVLEAAPPAPPGHPEPGFESPPELADGEEPVLPAAPIPESLASQAPEPVVAEPEPEVLFEPEPQVAPAPVPAELPEEFRFVKNNHTGEQITFLDGSKFSFTSPKRPGPAALLVTKNVEFAKKLLAVADVYGIVQQ